MKFTILQVVTLCFKQVYG